MPLYSAKLILARPRKDSMSAYYKSQVPNVTFGQRFIKVNLKQFNIH